MIEMTCAHCGNPFKSRPVDVKRGRKFCSPSCGSTFRRGERLPQTATMVPCAHCGKEFLKSPSKCQATKHGVYFCCRNHKDIAQRIGGVASIQPPHYGTGTQEYRAIAFRSLPAVCNRCGYDRIPGVLVVHHIDRDHNHSNLSNLEILCPTCHSEEHFNAGDGMWWERPK